MKALAKFPKQASRECYKGQKVMSLLKALRSNEIRKRTSLERQNQCDDLYNRYKIAGFLVATEYQLALDLYYTYVLLDRVDEDR